MAAYRPYDERSPVSDACRGSASRRSPHDGSRSLRVWAGTCCPFRRVHPGRQKVRSGCGAPTCGPLETRSVCAGAVKLEYPCFSNTMRNAALVKRRRISGSDPSHDEQPALCGRYVFCYERGSRICVRALVWKVCMSVSFLIKAWKLEKRRRKTPAAHAVKATEDDFSIGPMRTSKF